MRVLFLFGPNLGTLGRRDPERYGSQTLEEIMGEVGERGARLGHEVSWRQSDHEGELVGWLNGAAAEGFEAAGINPGALTPYSYALRGAAGAGPGAAGPAAAGGGPRGPPGGAARAGPSAWPSSRWTPWSSPACRT